MHGEGLPCLQRCVESVIEALQPLLGVLLRNVKFPFIEMNSVVSNAQNNASVLPFCTVY